MRTRSPKMHFSADTSRVIAVAFVCMANSAPAIAEEHSGEPITGRITIGAALSFKGRYEQSGLHTYNGYELAVKRINQLGGIKIGENRYELDIVYEDDQSDSKLSARLAERLIKEDGIKYLLGPYSSGLTMAVARVAEELEIPLVAAEGASKSLFTRGFRSVFGLFTTSDHYMDGVIELAIEEATSQGQTPSQLKLAIAVQNDRFSQFVRRAVNIDARSAGINVVVDETLPDSLEEMTGFFARVRETKPDIIIVSGVLVPT